MKKKKKKSKKNVSKNKNKQKTGLIVIQKTNTLNYLNLVIIDLELFINFMKLIKNIKFSNPQITFLT